MTDGAPRTSITAHVRAVGVSRLFVGFVGVIMLFGPAVLWGFGARAGTIENRPFAAKPALSQGFEMSDQFTAWFTDRLPLRSDAVDIRRSVSEGLFGEPPPAVPRGGPVGAGSGLSGGTRYETNRAGQALPGKDGWLYFGEDFVRACKPQQPLSQALAQLRRLSAALRAAGKHSVLVMMPDKSTVETSRLPKDLPERSCAAIARKARYDGMRALGLPDQLDMRSVFERLQSQTREPVYLSTDTHITARGSAEFVRAVVERLSSRAARTARLVEQRAPTVSDGDLSVIQGQPRTISERALRFVKPGSRRDAPQEFSPFPGFALTRMRATGTKFAPVVPGRTVWYGDSFTQRALPNVGTFFSDVWWVPELSGRGASKQRDIAVSVLVDQIREAENVVIETIERNAFGLLRGSILDPSVVDRIVAELARNPDRAAGS